ncbi:MAG: YceI family protein [Saprospiraceae bacterium]
MKKLKFLLFVSVLFFALGIQESQYFPRSRAITFTSSAPMEKIEAVNQKATSVIDTESGKMEFAVLIKAFQFEKALMQEHFNENYMESDKYPKAKFKGAIVDISKVDFAKDGTYEVTVKGNLTIHGETNEVETTGTFTIANGAISATSTFEIAVADYKIKIPKVVRDNIAKTVSITVDMNYELFKKKS